MSSLPHIQMLASFWAPLALLGLHGYLDSVRSVRPQPGDPVRLKADTAYQWLALYGAAWALQVMANSYTLVLFSVLVGLWVLWFVVVRREWRALGMITAATAAAALPVIPIVYKYVSVHVYHGFERNADEIRAFSADVAAVFCAPPNLTFWGWIRVACRAEGELFPGVALLVLVVAALWWALAETRQDADRSRARRILVVLRRVMLIVAALYALIVASVLIVGPWSIDAGLIHVSASDIDKPLLVVLALSVAALLLSLGGGAARASSAAVFYLFAAVTMWLFALGPVVTLMGESSGRPGPFALLQMWPGVTGLRVPARFWSMSVMCLAIAAGVFVAHVLRQRTRQTATAVVTVVACALIADSWIDRIGAPPAPPPVPDSAALAGNVALQFPIDPFPDMANTWRAVTGGWRTINGYSGYGPNYYETLRQAAKAADPQLLEPFLRTQDLQVIVAADEVSARAMIENQSGAVLIARGGGFSQYRLPQRGRKEAAEAPRLPIVSVHSTCASDSVPLMVDGDERTDWNCVAPPSSHDVTIDLGHTSRIGAVVYSVGRFSWTAPGEMVIDTSVDGVAWTLARSGSVRGEFIAGGLRDPASLRATLRFAPRDARYVRLRPVVPGEEFGWVIAELEVRAAP
jgi:hypothetical protein